MVALKAWRGPTGLLLLGWLLCPSFLGADNDFLDAYKQGRKAIGNQQWDLAAEKMREALAGRSEESPRLAKKRYFRKYLPHYFLGVALFELGDCERALESWAESERQGVVTRRKEYAAKLSQSREQCQARARLADQIGPLERQLAKLDAEVVRASRLKRDPEIQGAWNAGSPSLAERQARAEGNLRHARSRLGQARSQADLDLLPGVEKLLADARRERSAFEQQAAAQRANMQSSRLDEEQEGLPGNAEPQQEPPSMGVDPPPAELDFAVKAFLSGDYPRVLEILEGFSAEERRTRAHAHLLRSAALSALHDIRGNTELLILAREAAREAYTAEPELTLPERFFSPRFRELFRASNRSDQED